MGILIRAMRIDNRDRNSCNPTFLKKMRAKHTLIPGKLYNIKRNFFESVGTRATL